jgi:tRNA(Ile)-lysidine synthase
VRYANVVSSNLYLTACLDIPTQVLNIKWRDENPKTEDIIKLSSTPGKASNFESLAREYRFQLLGQACKESGINSLLLAHHEDDRVETVMMRLINGHQMIGLSGMMERSAIPECHGMHGIHESGGLDELSRFRLDDSERQSQVNPEVRPEKGGVEIFKPLLGFSKDRLVATCRSRMSEWFEDNTNKDPTLTQRNAIRHLYSNYTLPAAFQKPSILALAQRARFKSESRSKLAESWLRESKFANFDSRVGSVEVAFPHLHKLKEYSTLTRETLKAAAAELLRRVMMLVTPQQSIDLSSLHRSSEVIFPELFDHTQNKNPLPFTISRIMFQPVYDRGSGEQKFNWVLSRQPYSRTEKLPLIKIDKQVPAVRHLSMPQQNTLTEIDENVQQVNWSPWTLYDGRFWIRVRNIFPGTLTVEPYQQSFRENFVSMLSMADQKRYLKLIKKVAPDHIRWTLPCIRFQRENWLEKDAAVLALPTLGLVARKWIEQDRKEKRLLGVELVSEEVWFEVRYRKVYTQGMAGI